MINWGEPVNADQYCGFSITGDEYDDDWLEAIIIEDNDTEETLLSLTGLDPNPDGYVDMTDHILNTYPGQEISIFLVVEGEGYDQGLSWGTTLTGSLEKHSDLVMGEAPYTYEFVYSVPEDTSESRTFTIRVIETAKSVDTL